MSMHYLQPKRDRFYYLIVTDLQKQRDDKISMLFDEETHTQFLSEYTKHNFSTTPEIHLARFWKDEKATRRVMENFIKIESQKGYFVVKLIKTNCNGIPDLLAIKNGIAMFVEVKQPTGKVSPIQEFRIKQLREYGCKVFIWVDYERDINYNFLFN